MQLVPRPSGLIWHKNVRKHFLCSYSYVITFLCHLLQPGKRAVALWELLSRLPKGSRGTTLRVIPVCCKCSAGLPSLGDEIAVWTHHLMCLSSKGRDCFDNSR